jgi:hypothetical protein
MRGALCRRFLDLNESLAFARGWGYATERAQRDMLAKTGWRPGERSIGRVARKLARDGVIERIRLMPGAQIPGVGPKKYAKHGLCIVRCRSRQEQRANRRNERKAREHAKAREARPAPVQGPSKRAWLRAQDPETVIANEQIKLFAETLRGIPSHSPATRQEQLAALASFDAGAKGRDPPR